VEVGLVTKYIFSQKKKNLRKLRGWGWGHKASVFPSHENVEGPDFLLAFIFVSVFSPKFPIVAVKLMKEFIFLRDEEESLLHATFEISSF
jgi:hypothetical protein